jgi:hypothetical protein
MKTLEEAWKWYDETKRPIRLVRRLAQRYWADLPWDGKLENDDQFKLIEAGKLDIDADFTLSQLDDLAVLVLFAVFESMVRGLMITEISAEIDEKGISHTMLLRSFKDLVQQVGEGSFFRVVEPYKALDPNLVEEVNQVRRYRNWVAHGRRGDQPEIVSPLTAYQRLRRYMKLLATHSDATEHDDPPETE